MGNHQLNQSLDNKIKQFETNVEEVIASAFKLQSQLGRKGCSNRLADQMQCMAICAYHASGNLLATMFRHNFDCAAKIKPPPAKNYIKRQKAKGTSCFEDFKGENT